MNVAGLICLIFFVLICADVANARRGGGGFSGGRFSGGSRSSGSRYSGARSSVRITETRVKVRYGSRYKPWNYGYNNWYSYGSYGHIYGFVWYTRTSHYRNNPNKEPVICRNEFDNVMDNGTHYEWFICPSQNHTSDYHYCCGEDDKQYCCRFWDDGWRTFGVVTSFLFFSVFVVGLCYCCCCRKTTHTETTYFQRVISRKISSRAETDIPLHPASGPTYPPQPVPLPPQPMETLSLNPVMPQQPGFMPMPMPHPQPGFAMPDASYVPAPPAMSEMHVPSMPGVPPYPMEGVPDRPPSYTPFQPSAPPYTTDSNLPYPPAGPTSATPYPAAPYPTAPGYPNSPPPPYGQM